MSYPSSRKRCGVSACVSMTRAESCILRARGLIEASGEEACDPVWAQAREADTRRNRSLFVITRDVDASCRLYKLETSGARLFHNSRFLAAHGDRFRKKNHGEKPH